MNFKYRAGRAVERAWFRRRVGKTFGDVSYYNASLGGENIKQKYTLDRLSLSTHVRGDIPFLPVEEPRPAAQITRYEDAYLHIQHINALLYVTLRRGAGRGSNLGVGENNRNGMTNRQDDRTCEVTCRECTADHAPRDASLLPLSLGKVQNCKKKFSCDAVTSSSRTRGVGLEEVRVGSRYVTADPFWEVRDDMRALFKGSKRTTRHPLITPRR